MRISQYYDPGYNNVSKNATVCLCNSCVRNWHSNVDRADSGFDVGNNGFVINAVCQTVCRIVEAKRVPLKNLTMSFKTENRE